MCEFPVLEDDESRIHGERIFDAAVQPHMKTFEYDPSFRDVVKTFSGMLDNSQSEIFPFERKVSTLNALNYFVANMSHFTGYAKCVRDVYVKKINKFYKDQNISKNEYNYYMSFV